MNVLIVEDDIDFSTAVDGEIGKLTLPTVRRHARSMISAQNFLEAEFFDLIILDLKIPTEDHLLNADSAHGIATFAYAKANAPGTPILVLTGSPADEHIDVILKYSKQADVWGEGHQIQMTTFLSKHKLGKLPGILKEYEKAIKEVLHIEISRPNCSLSVEQSRIIRIFSKSYNAGRCAITKLSGGLSGTTVYRLHTSDWNGNTIHNAVCKVGSMDEIVDESKRYDKYVSRLDAVATPRKLVELLTGAKSTAGVFYSLVQGYPFTGFGIVNLDEAFIRKVITSLEGLFTPWRGGEFRKSVADIRKRILGDEKFDECKALLSVAGFNFEWIDDFEKQEIQTRWHCTHGDLHGLNILISQDGAPILIDYGDVAEGPVSLDPVTLELSLHFHPEGPLRGSNWPSVQQAYLWGDLENYLTECPCPDFIRACRSWSENVAPAAREIAVSAYAYLMRQARYPNANLPLIGALIVGAKAMYDDTFK